MKPEAVCEVFDLGTPLGMQPVHGGLLHETWRLDTASGSSFLTQGVGHHERVADRLARHGHPVEWGIGRHGPGGNLFLYARDPSGNRVEFIAEMARVPDPDAPTRFWTGDPMKVLNQWGVAPPPSFGEGT